MRKIAIVIAVLAMQDTAQAAAELTCTISEKMRCTQETGCNPVENSIIVRINPDNQTYSRCDSKGCDDFPAEIGVSGAYVNIAVPKNGMLAKFSTDGSVFVEVVTLGATVLLSYGSCK